MKPLISDPQATQVIINNIAGILVQSSIDREEETKHLSTITALIQLYKNLIDTGSKPAKINKLTGVSWADSAITDLEELIDSSDTQVDEFQAYLSNESLKNLSNMKHYKDKGLPAPTVLLHRQEELGKLISSIGYTPVDRKMTIACHDYEQLCTVGNYADIHGDWEAFVDTRSNGTAEMSVYYPSKMHDEILDEIRKSGSDISVISVEPIVPALPGFKDVEDFERKQSLKEELSKDPEFSM